MVGDPCFEGMAPGDIVVTIPVGDMLQEFEGTLRGTLLQWLDTFPLLLDGNKQLDTGLPVLYCPSLLLT